MICPRLFWRVLISSTVALSAIGGAPARAQSVGSSESKSAVFAVPLPHVPEPAAQTGSPRAAGGAWEIEVHGGGLFSSVPTQGTTALPPPGALFPLAGGIVTTRRVSSYYFGDGALLLNQTNVTPARITPLDPVLNSPFVERPNGASFGVRVTRRLTPRFAAELSIDYLSGHLRTTDAARTGIEATRTSFANVFNGILNRGFPITGNQVTSTAAFAGEDQGHRLSTIGALVVNLAAAGMFVPYATAGVGMLSTTTETPSVTLAGNYRFVLGGFPSITESDTVVVRSSVGNKVFAGMVGGGVKTFFSPRFGVRVDVRVQFSRNHPNTLVDATPRVPIETPSTAITFASTTGPSLRFSNFPQTDLQSSLSGPPIKDFQTFTGTGTERQVAVTGALIVRFPGAAGGRPRAVTRRVN